MRTFIILLYLFSFGTTDGHNNSNAFGFALKVPENSNSHT